MVGMYVPLLLLLLLRASYCGGMATTCSEQVQRRSLLSFLDIANGGASSSGGASSEHRSGRTAAQLSSCTSQSSCSEWGESTSCVTTCVTTCENHSVAVALPDYCCWQGVFCCTTASCCSYGTQDTSCSSTRTSRSPYCNCEVGTVVELRRRDYAMTAALPDLLQPLYNMSCNLRSLELQSNQLSSSIPEAITALSALHVLNLADNRECMCTGGC